MPNTVDNKVSLLVRFTVFENSVDQTGSVISGRNVEKMGLSAETKRTDHLNKRKVGLEFIQFRKRFIIKI